MILKYFWIVEYIDGTALSQFDPDTGKERQWKEVDISQVCRVSWAEFSHNLRKKIAIDVISVKNPKIYYADFGPGEEILICRRNHILLSTELEEKDRRIEYLIGRKESKDNEKIIVRLE